MLRPRLLDFISALHSDYRIASNLPIHSSLDVFVALPAVFCCFQLKRHGVLNVVGWGILMPIGAMIARYLRQFESADPAWFYLHAFCQTSGYILGVAGWATCIKLGSYSKGIVFHKHRAIGIVLFAFGTLQVLALLARPKKEHKFRKYWNVYHHTIGYTIIVLSVVNIFKGFDMLRPDSKWKHAYIAVIASLGGIAVFLEIVSWIIFFQRKGKTSSKSANGMNSDGRVKNRS
eukprot:Gb_30568 [translate_table: standard]